MSGMEHDLEKTDQECINIGNIISKFCAENYSEKYFIGFGGETRIMRGSRLVKCLTNEEELVSKKVEKLRKSLVMTKCNI